MKDWNLPEYDARNITEDIAMADYFEAVCAHTGNQKAAANWMLGTIRSWMNEHNAGLEIFPVKPATIAAMIALVDTNKISSSSATSRLFTHLLGNADDDPAAAAGRLGLIQESDAGELEPLIDQVLAQFEAKVAEYKKGKKGLLALFVGEVMKRSKGKADPKVTNQLLLEKLKS